MSDLKDILKGSLNRLGIARQVEAVGVVEAAKKEIAKFVDPNDFEVVSFNKGVLKVFASSSVVASEIKMRERNISTAIGVEIKRIVFVFRVNEAV